MILSCLISISIYARKSGAENVYSCEMDSFMCEIATDILQSNNEDKIQLINKHSDKLIQGKHITER